MIFLVDLIVGVIAFFSIRATTPLDGWSLVVLTGLIVCFVNVFLVAKEHDQV